MAYNCLVMFLVACLLMATGFANDEAEAFHLIFDGSVIELPADNVHKLRSFLNPVLLPRAEMATVTVTETVCEPGSPETSIFITLPTSLVVTETSANPTTPTTEQPSPPLETQSAPSTGPTTSDGTTSATSVGQTTTPHASSQTSVDTTETPTEAPTEAPTDTPTSSPSQPPNSATAQKGMHPAFLALVVTFVYLWME